MRFLEAPFEYPYTLERALDAAMRLHRGDCWDTEQGGARVAMPAGLATPAFALDSEQLRAVGAHDGVVQVIAPAGSVKTSVLIERVRELLRRGARAERILCLTFNRAAADELRQRLRAAGVGGVEARTFHGLGWRLMLAEGLARPGEVRPLSAAEWKRLCTMARRETGDWVDPGDSASGFAPSPGASCGTYEAPAGWTSSSPSKSGSTPAPSRSSSRCSSTPSGTPRA